MTQFSGADSYARQRIESLSRASKSAANVSAAGRASSSLKTAELQKRVEVLEQVVISLLDVLQRSGAVSDDDMAETIENIGILDANGDGEINSDDLIEKYGIESDEIDQRIDQLTHLKGAARARLRRRRNRG